MRVGHSEMLVAWTGRLHGAWLQNILSVPWGGTALYADSREQHPASSIRAKEPLDEKRSCFHK
jgi:hypothetical protein